MTEKSIARLKEEAAMSGGITDVESPWQTIK
jgi:hypothetical protein